MLQSVRVRRFKGIGDATIPLGRVTLLVGPNNAGKSSVLQATLNNSHANANAW
jgi:predicted ATP-dependent endonuclease of OLD family